MNYIKILIEAIKYSWERIGSPAWYTFFVSFIFIVPIYLFWFLPRTNKIEGTWEGITPFVLCAIAAYILENYRRKNGIGHTPMGVYKSRPRPSYEKAFKANQKQKRYKKQQSYKDFRQQQRANKTHQQNTNNKSRRPMECPKVSEARQVLGVTHDATLDEVKQAYRRLMQKVHPDRGGCDYLAAQINNANDVLMTELATE